MLRYKNAVKIYRISFLYWVLSKRKSNTLKPSCSSAICMSDIIQKLGITSISTYPVITKVWVSADIHGCYLSGFIRIVASMQCLAITQEYCSMSIIPAAVKICNHISWHWMCRINIEPEKSTIASNSMEAMLCQDILVINAQSVNSITNRPQIISNPEITDSIVIFPTSFCS